MNLLNLYETNRICPMCRNPNYMVSLLGVSDVFQYKCTNCNSYFTFDDLTPRTSTIKKDLVEVVRCKDCKHGSLYCTEDVCGETLIECNRPDLGDVIEIHGWKWFCADGEKKDSDDKAAKSTIKYPKTTIK